MPDIAPLKVSNAKRCLDQGTLKALLNYDSATGLFSWKVSRGRYARPGLAAGTLHKVKRSNSPYIRIKIDGRSYLAHRLAFLYMTGKWPDAEPDHISTDTTDNRWENLREATSSQNQANRKVRRDNKLGIKGVHYCKRDKRFIATFQINGRQKRLGGFKTAEEAQSAYAFAVQSHFGEFARVA